MVARPEVPAPTTFPDEPYRPPRHDRREIWGAARPTPRDCSCWIRAMSFMRSIMDRDYALLVVSSGSGPGSGFGPLLSPNNSSFSCSIGSSGNTARRYARLMNFGASGWSVA